MPRDQDQPDQPQRQPKADGQEGAGELTLNKDTLRDLQAPDGGAGDVRGGMIPVKTKARPCVVDDE
jgi:hypothetical protein